MIFFPQWGHIDRDMSLQITWVHKLQIRLRQPFEIQTIQPKKCFEMDQWVVVVVVVVVVGQTVGSISSKTLAYDCLCTLELCTASMIATS